MLKTFKIALIAFVLVMTNTGCLRDKGFVPPQMSFEKYKVISINAKKVEIVNKYEMPMTEPHVEHLFPVSLQTTVNNLIDSRLLAMGEQNTLMAMIDELSVIREPVEKDKSFTGFFKKQPSEILKARISIRFQLVDSNNPDIILGHSTLLAKREKTLIEGMSVTDKQKAYYELTQDLVDDINQGFQETVKKYFGVDKF